VNWAVKRKLRDVKRKLRALRRKPNSRGTAIREARSHSFAAAEVDGPQRQAAEGHGEGKS